MDYHLLLDRCCHSLSHLTAESEVAGGAGEAGGGALHLGGRLHSLQPAGGTFVMSVNWDVETDECREELEDGLELTCRFDLLEVSDNVRSFFPLLCSLGFSCLSSFLSSWAPPSREFSCRGARGFLVTSW